MDKIKKMPETSSSEYECSSSGTTSPVPEASTHSKSPDTGTTSASGSGKRKSKSSSAPNKKKVPYSKVKRSMASMTGPSTSNAKWSSSSSEREDCPICRKQLGRKPVAIPDCCNHSFCYECIISWVTKAKSNCPMDRKDITLLKVYDKGKLITSEVVEPKVPEEEEVGVEDEGEICPDCGWIGIRPSIGVCLHCMFHHDHPWPVDDCPQCMEAESNASDDDWEPASTSRTRRRIIRCSESSEVEVMSSEEESAVATSESENEGDEEFNLSEIDQEESQHAEPVASTSVRRAPVRRKTKRKVTKRKRRTVKRKATGTRKKTTTKKKRKVKKRTTATGTATKRKRKTTTRRTTRKKRKVSLKSRRRQARRQIAPSDSAKARLAKLLGLRPPKDPRQLIPRGCKPRPVTSAQFAAACASTSNMVTTRPVGSLSYHHRPLPTLHLFGGDELDYFPSDSDSERGGAEEGSVVTATRRAHTAPSETASARRLIRRKGISIPAPRPTSSTQPKPVSTPVDILGSILESQTLMRSRFDIHQDGSIKIHGKNSANSTPSRGQSPRLNLGQAGSRLAAQRPSGPSSSEPRDTNQPADRTFSSSSTQENNYTNNIEYQDSSVAASNTNVNNTESGYTEQQTGYSNDGSPSSNINKNKASPTSQDDDEEIDIYSDIPTSEPLKEQDNNCQNLSLSPAADADTSMASFVTSDSEIGDVDDDTDDDVVVDDDDEEEEEEEGHERMVIDETDAAIQSPPRAIAAVLVKEPVEEPAAIQSEIPSTQTIESSPGYGRDASTLYGSGSPCYGGGSPQYTAADTVDRLDPYPDEVPRTVDRRPNLFTYSAASMELARNCGVEEEESDRLGTSPIASPVSPEGHNECVPDQPTAVEGSEFTEEENMRAAQIVSDRNSTEKPNRRQSLVEEIFGSESEGEGGVYEHDLPPLPPAPCPEQLAQMTGLEGLDTETISETEEEANFNDPEDVIDKRNSVVSQTLYLTTKKPSVSSSSSGKAEIDYEEGEIVEDRPRIYQSDIADVFNLQQINEPPTSLVPTSPVSPEPCNMDNMETFNNNTPMSPVAHEERPLSRPQSDSRRRDKSPDRRRRRDSRNKKTSKKSESDKLNANIEWKKLSKNSKERNYRDGKAKENVSYERSDKKDRPRRDSREDRRSKKKKEKRKDLERYDVRKVITERSRREAERRRRDKFGRDISRERSHSPSPSHSPQNVSRNHSRNRRRTPEADYQGARSRGKHHRNDSWSSNHSHYSLSASSRGSSPHLRHHSNSSRHRHNHSREDEKSRERRVRPRSISRSPSRSHSMEMARQSRRDQYNQEPRITIVTSHERLTSQGMKTSHIQIPDSVITASMISSASNAANKKKAEKPKDKKKKDTKKKKKEHHRHVLAPLAPAGSVINNNPSVAGVALSSIAMPEKKKRKREKSPPASKEVFASGDNILVSVNFNKPVMPMQSSATSSLAVMPKSKELIPPTIAPPVHMQQSNQKRVVKDNQHLLRSDSHGRPAPKRVKRDMGRKMPEHCNVMSDRSPRRKSNDLSRSALAEKQQLNSQQAPSRKRDDGMKRRKRIAEIAAKRKPVAIIDLESSPFAERAPSPAVVITLSDNEGRLSSSSRSSRPSSVEDNRRSRRRMDKEEQRPRKQRKPSKSDLKGMDRQMPMTAPIINTAPTVALGPKTPPEPQIKFSINAKPQLRSITNPLQDEDDDTELDAANTASMTSRDKSEIDLNNAVNAGLVTSNSGIPTLIVGSHSISNVYRGPNTPPEPQSRSSSCSTTTKLDNDASKGDSHIPQSPVDAKSPDVYDPFEPTKSPSSDTSSLEHQPDISQPNDEDLSQQPLNSMVSASALTPGSMSDNSENSSRLIPQVPESPTPENIVDHSKHQNSHDEEINRKEEAVSNKTENVVRPHHIASQVEDEQPSSPVQATAKSAADTVDTSEMKPTSTTTTILMPPPVVNTPELFTTLPPSVANILCSQQHPSLYRPQIDATIAAVPLLLSNTLLSLKLSQQALAAANQQLQAQPAQQQQQQPDTTTTTDVVDMDLESPYSPGSTEGDDLFEPPDKPPSPTYMPRNEKKANKSSRLAHPKRNTTDKFDALFSQSTPMKKEASSTSGNKGTRGRSHAHRTTKGRHTRADKSESKASKVGSTKNRSKNANASNNDKSKGKKEISIKMDEDQLKILDDLPSSAVEMQVKEKFLKKLNRQERVVEEVKLALKPHYTKKLVNKEEYKEILRRSVPKICHNKTGEINPIRIRSLVSEYVKKFRYLKKKDTTRPRGKTEKQRKNS